MGKFLCLVRMVVRGSIVALKTIYCGFKFSTIHFHYLSLTILQQAHALMHEENNLMINLKYLVKFSLFLL